MRMVEAEKAKEESGETMSMKITLSEFMGMDTWPNEKLCAYVDNLNELLKKRDDLIRDMFLTWKRLDLEGDWPTHVDKVHNGHNGWKTFERRVRDMGIDVEV